MLHEALEITFLLLSYTVVSLNIKGCEFHIKLFNFLNNIFPGYEKKSAPWIASFFILLQTKSCRYEWKELLISTLQEQSGVWMRCSSPSVCFVFLGGGRRVWNRNIWKWTDFMSHRVMKPAQHREYWAETECSAQKAQRVRNMIRLETERETQKMKHLQNLKDVGGFFYFQVMTYDL